MELGVFERGTSSIPPPPTPPHKMVATKDQQGVPGGRMSEWTEKRSMVRGLS